MHSSSTILAFTASLALALAAPHTLHKRDVSAFDISSAQAASFWSCAASNGYSKVVIRGYQQACGSGGRVDPNFLPSYQAAKGAGLAVDSYMFPCTGTQPAGDPPCKPIQTQLDEFLGVIADNDMILDTLWFDLEPTSGACNAWNLSPQQNTDLARQWVAALQGTKLKWGIYANGNQWTSMFPSRDTDVGSSLPLWAVQFDKKPGVGTVDTFMGGWTTAVGKQYDLDTTLCGGPVDLNSFA